MNGKYLTTLAAGLVVLTAQAPAHAQEAAGGLAKLYGNLSAVLCQGTDASSILIMSSPGLPLSQSFDTTNDDDLDILNTLADYVPKAGPYFMPNGGQRYSVIYKTILDQNQRALPVPLSQAEKDQLAADRKLVSPDSPERQAYDKYSDRYDEALTNFENAQQGGKTPSQSVIKKKNDALKDWGNNGYKKDIEAATDRIRMLTSKDGGAWWTMLNDKLSGAQKGDNYTATYFPKANTWNDMTLTDWTSFKFKTSDTSKSTSSSASSIQAAASYSRGPVDVGVSFSKDDFTADQALDASDFEISFEIKRVNIYRKWMDVNVFSNNTWWWPNSVHLGTLSFGNLKDNIGKAPAMPCLVTSFFLCRKLTMKSKFFSDHASQFSHSMDVHAHVSVGPFSASGGYSKKDTGTQAKTSLAEGAISCDGVQIIGYLATIPPACPSAPGH